jgi:hypothetical protein
VCQPKSREHIKKIILLNPYVTSIADKEKNKRRDKKKVADVLKIEQNVR